MITGSGRSLLSHKFIARISFAIIIFRVFLTAPATVASLNLISLCSLVSLVLYTLRSENPHIIPSHTYLMISYRTVIGACIPHELRSAPGPSIALVIRVASEVIA